MLTSEKLLVRALRGETLERPPFWLMRQAGRYLPEYREIRSKTKNFLDLCYSPEKAIEVTLQPLRRYHMDAAIVFSDILVIPHALGQEVRFEEGRGPVLDRLESVEDIQSLNGDGLAAFLQPVYDTLAGLRESLPSDVALIGFAGAPWTVSTYMVEGGTSRNHERVKRWAYGAPDDFQRLIDLLVDATATHLKCQIDAGAEVVQIFDTWAGALSADAMERWCLRPVVEIARRVHAAHPDVPVLAFPRGVGSGYAKFAAAPGISGLSLDSSVDPEWARREIQPHCAVQGNLDPILLVAGGSEMDEAVNRILSTLAQGPFIFNLGHGIVPETPPEHVERLANLIQGWPG